MIESIPLHFRNNREKAAFMQRNAIRASRTAPVLRWAAQFRPIARPWRRAAACLNFCAQSIDYLRDPRVEILDSPAVLDRRGRGDCDAKATAMVAIGLAVDLEAEILPVYKGPDFPHVLGHFHLPWDEDELDLLRALNVRTPDMLSPRRMIWVPGDPSLVNGSLGFIPRHPKTNAWGTT